MSLIYSEPIYISRHKDLTIDICAYPSTDSKNHISKDTDA